jgi:phage portal protein BeeE
MDRHGAPAILSGGMTLQTLTLSPRDMALLELRTFDEVRIATALGVPPYLAGLPSPDGMTYNTAALVADWHWRSTLRPFATAFSAAFSWWALPGRQRLEFNGDEYTRPAMADLVPVLMALVTGGVMTVDEARVALHLGPMETSADDRVSFVLGPT